MPSHDDQLTFDDLNLNKGLWTALEDMGLEHPTAIQRTAFPVIMSGRDAVGIAQTGTGKTLAFLLPALRQWRFVKHPYPQILVLVPTRELVQQVVGQVELLTKYMSFVTLGIYGGANIHTQQQLLQDGVDLIVATPGRIVDIAMTGTVKFRHLRQLIVDEVDEMLELGFRPQLMNVLDMLPKKRQNLLFSATMTRDIELIIAETFNTPVYVTAARSGTPLAQIEQFAYPVANFNTKLNLLSELLRDAGRFRKTLVFAPTKRLADLAFERLEADHPGHATVIHGNKAQNARFRALRNFEEGDKRVLVATDLVSRGLDLTEVSHVVNLDVPSTPEDYIHRIGRTGRVDASGEAISFYTDKEMPHVANAEGLMRREIARLPFPEGVPVSKELIPEERPQINMPTVEVKLRETGGKHHERSAKRKKVNRGNRRSRELKAKMDKKGIKKKSR